MKQSQPLVLITRPAADAPEMVQQLTKCGIESFIEPMLHFRPLIQTSEKIKHVMGHRLQGVVVTSRHALPALAEHPMLTQKPLFVVGRTTARRARMRGFTDLHYASTVTGLLRQVMRYATPDRGALLYVRARDISKDIKLTLQRYGYRISEVLAYEMTASPQLSAVFQTLLKEQKFTAATFCSRRTAETFVELIQQAGLQEHVKPLHCFTFSENIAEPLRTLEWETITISEKPELLSLVSAVDKQLCKE